MSREKAASLHRTSFTGHGLPRWSSDPIILETMAHIREYGWSVTAVSDTCQRCAAECGSEFSLGYTTGLGLHAIPELAVYGLDGSTSVRVLNEVAVLLHDADWRELVAEEATIHLRCIDAPVRLVELLDNSDLLITNELFPDADLLQVIWSDEWGHFPGDDDYTLNDHDQPIKGILDSDIPPVRVRRMKNQCVGLNRGQRRQAARTRKRR